MCLTKAPLDERTLLQILQVCGDLEESLSGFLFRSVALPFFDALALPLLPFTVNAFPHLQAVTSSSKVKQIKINTPFTLFNYLCSPSLVCNSASA